MKTLLSVAAGAMAAIMFWGCASQETTTTTTANPARRTYTNSQLNRTGQPDTAGAIQAVDPDAQITR